MDNENEDVVQDTTYNFEVEMQKKIVALLFQDFTYLSTVGVELIKPSFFDNVYLQNICQWIISYYEQYHTKPTESVLLTELNNYTSKYAIPIVEQENFASVIRSLTTTVIEDAQYIKDQALDFAKSVAMRDAIGKLVDMYDKTNDYEKAVSIIDDALSVGAGTNLGLDLVSSLDELPQMLRDSYGRDNMFTTGIPSLDDAFGGGIAKGELYVFCLTGDTKVKTNKGFIEIKDLVNNFKDKKAYSVDENGNSFETDIYNVWKTRDTDELIELTFDNGYTIKCTPDHKFRITNPKKGDEKVIWSEGVAYKKAEDLSEDDEF